LLKVGCLYLKESLVCMVMIRINIEIWNKFTGNKFSKFLFLIWIYFYMIDDNQFSEF
jgi:hypothetical protein